MARKILTIFGALVALYILCFAGLGLNPLLDPDEPIYGQFVKEMVRTGDWLTPHYAGRLWFDKPPLFYWLSSLSVKALGLNEAAVRMPSALLAVLVLVGVYLLAKIDFGRRAAILASVVMATSLLQIVVSHAAATDEAMLFCMVAALYSYRKWFDCVGRARYAWMAACGAAIGLGVLAKGPVVPVLLGATFVCHLLWTREIRKLWSPDVALAGLVAAFVGLPWYIAMWVMHGQVFVDQFLLANNVTRFIRPLHSGQSGHWYSHFKSVGLLLLFLFPWNVFLPAALRRYTSVSVGAKLLTCWAVVVLGFFSLSKTQNFTYTLPVFPACAVFIGALLDEAVRSTVLRKNVKRALIAGCVLSLLYAVALFVTISRKYPEASAFTAVPASMLFLLFVIPTMGLVTGKLSFAKAPFVVGAFMVAFTGLAIGGLMPLASDSMSSKTLAAKIRRLPAAEIATFDLWRPGLQYYLDRTPIDVKDAHNMAHCASSDTPLLIVCDEKHEAFVEQYFSIQVLDCGNLDVYSNEAATAMMESRVPQRTATDRSTASSSEPTAHTP